MNGYERRMNIIEYLQNSDKAVSGKDLASLYHVSSQVIVHDIALLRAKDYDIVSTNHGYILNETKKVTRVFKVKHSDEKTQEELECIVDYGGIIEDVFIYHRRYGIVRAKMNIRSRNDIIHFLEDLKSGKSTYLKNVTSDYHYHTVSAPTETILNLIEKQLEEKGFIAQLQDYEPEDIKKSS